MVSSVLEKNGIPGAVAGLVTGGKDTGKTLVESNDVELGSDPSNTLWKMTQLKSLLQCHLPEVKKLAAL